MQTAWNLPTLDAGIGGSYPIPVVFLTRVSDAEREALFADINSSEEDDETPLPERPISARPRALAHVPWIRSTVPDTTEAIYTMEGDGIFVDERTMRERAAGDPGSVVVVSSILKHGAVEGAPAEKSVDAVRVGARRAKPIVSRLWDLWDAKKITSLSDVVPDYAGCRLDFSGPEARATERKRQSEEDAARRASDDQEYVYVLPAHLPVDLKLAPEELTLVSLVHLEDSEVEQLEKAISAGAAANEPCAPFRILNWPSNREPGTWNDMYRIFRAIRLPFNEDTEDRFALFIDKAESDDPNPGEIEVLLVQQNLRRFPSYPDPNLEVSKLNDIGSAPRIWRAVFDPLDPKKRGKRGKSLRFYDDGSISSMRNLADPDHLAIGGDGNDFCIVFLLCPMSKARVQQIREELGRDWEVQLYDVSHQVATPDLRGLIGLLESAEFRRYSVLPSQFIAVDQTTLEDSEGKSCIITEAAVSYFEDANGREIATDDVGYGWGRVDYESAMSMWVNYSVANMSLEEDLGETIQHVYWSDILEEEVRKLDEPWE